MTRLEKWQALGGTRLLRHILTQAAQGVHYCDAGRNPDTAESYDLTRPLVDYKNAWVRDMLDYEQEHRAVPPPEEVCKRWAECMARAELQVDAVRHRYATGMAA